ncbi:cytochrome P450 [Myxococcota bacterium]|nr:cytochrome P450 [Myxococcota bacterium]
MPDPQTTLNAIHELRIDPLDTNFARNPYPVFRALRERDPVHWWEDGPGWVLTRFTDVVEGFKHPDLSGNIRHWELFREPTHPDLKRLRPYDDALLTALEDDHHNRVRRLVAKAFTPRSVARLEPVMKEILDDCLAPHRKRGNLELMQDVARSYPTRVISRMLGIPSDTQREQRFKELSDILISLTSPLVSEEERIAGAAAREEMLALVEEVLDERRHQPQDDILSALLAAEDDGQTLSTTELLSLVPLIILAGSETTANSLGIGLLDLLRHPDQFALFRDEPALRPRAIEELLRFQQPGYFLARYALRDLEFGGRKIRKGQLVLLSSPAAHRDPEAFPDPDHLDLRRMPDQTAVFGHGVHFCLGAQLARLELSTALTKLVDEFPGLRLSVPAEEVEFEPNIQIRTLGALPLAFDAA